MLTNRRRLWAALVTTTLVGELLAPALIAKSGLSPSMPQRSTSDSMLESLDFEWVEYLPLGEGTDSRAIDSLSTRPLDWLDTPHFRVGSGLADLRIGDLSREWRSVLEREIQSIVAEKRDSKLHPAGLDRHLRQVLLAAHLERTWSELSSMLPPIDDTTEPTGPAADLEGRGRGQGPMLGRDAKFVVIVFGEHADLRRFCVEFTGADARGAKRFDLGPNYGMVFCTAAEMVGGVDPDRSLRAHVTFGVVANILDGYRGSQQPTPAWLRFGLAQSFALAVDPTVHNSEDAQRSRPSGRATQSWQDMARRLPSADRDSAGRQLADLLARERLDGATTAELVRTWSHVEFLRQRDPLALGRFLFAQKARLPADFSKEPNDMLMQRQRDNLRDLLGFDDPAALERAWNTWRTRRAP